MASPNVHLVEMRDAAVARRDGDILELNVHIIFGCYAAQSSVIHFLVYQTLCRHMARYVMGPGTLRSAKEQWNGAGGTFEQLSSVDLSGCDLESDDVALLERRAR